MPETQAVIYTRYSPRPGESDSCDIQAEKCRAYCGIHDMAVIAEHRDEGLSGGTLARPGLTSSIELCCAKRAALVVYALARFARSTKDAITIVDQLDKAHADFISVSESIDTTTPHGRFMFTLTAALAQLEREQIADRTSVSMLVHQKNGRRMSRFAPFGWRIDLEDSSRLLVDDTEMKSVNHVLNLHANGFSNAQIARQLNENGVPYRNQRPWYREAVRRILRREQGQPSRTTFSAM